MIRVVLLEPETAGNVGAIARVMKNFDFHDLVLVNPHCDHLSPDARNRAKHSQEILQNAEVSEFFIVDDYDYLVATTAKTGTDYNIPRSPLSPADLALKLKGIDPKKKIGLVIGREGHGMFNEEIEKCDFVVTIPSAPEYSTLNISHAVAVMLYELHKVFADKTISSHITPIGKSEKDQISAMFKEIFDGFSWETPDKRVTQEKLWKRLVGKAMLTKREAYGMMGFLRKIIWVQGRKGLVKEKPVRKGSAKTPFAKRPVKKKDKKTFVKGTISKKGAFERSRSKSSGKPEASPKKDTQRVSAARAKSASRPRKAKPARPVRKKAVAKRPRTTKATKAVSGRVKR
ncbi:RNA methyltransferase [Nanoarchaeota archaeon]